MEFKMTAVTTTLAEGCAHLQLRSDGQNPVQLHLGKYVIIFMFPVVSKVIIYIA